eukprot:scaffold37188_cov31-Tisochrysis_lutea.AAC.3
MRSFTTSAIPTLSFSASSPTVIDSPSLTFTGPFGSGSGTSWVRRAFFLFGRTVRAVAKLSSSNPRSPRFSRRTLTRPRSVSSLRGPHRHTILVVRAAADIRSTALCNPLLAHGGARRRRLRLLAHSVHWIGEHQHCPPVAPRLLAAPGVRGTRSSFSCAGRPRLLGEALERDVGVAARNGRSMQVDVHHAQRRARERAEQHEREHGRAHRGLEARTHRER